MKTERTVEEIVNKVYTLIDMNSYSHLREMGDAYDGYGISEENLQGALNELRDFLSEAKPEKMCRIGHDPVKCTMDIPGHEKDCPIAKALINSNGVKEECNYWTDKER